MVAVRRLHFSPSVLRKRSFNSGIMAQTHPAHG
jgi:hypothetical protein